MKELLYSPGRDENAANPPVLCRRAFPVHPSRRPLAVVAAARSTGGAVPSRDSHITTFIKLRRSLPRGRPGRKGRSNLRIFSNFSNLNQRTGSLNGLLSCGATLMHSEHPHYPARGPGDMREDVCSGVGAPRCNGWRRRLVKIGRDSFNKGCARGREGQTLSPWDQRGVRENDR